MAKKKPSLASHDPALAKAFSVLSQKRRSSAKKAGVVAVSFG